MSFMRSWEIPACLTGVRKESSHPVWLRFVDFLQCWLLDSDLKGATAVAVHSLYLIPGEYFKVRNKLSTSVSYWFQELIIHDRKLTIASNASGAVFLSEEDAIDSIF